MGGLAHQARLEPLGLVGEPQAVFFPRHDPHRIAGIADLAIPLGALQAERAVAGEGRPADHLQLAGSVPDPRHPARQPVLDVVVIFKPAVDERLGAHLDRDDFFGGPRQQLAPRSTPREHAATVPLQGDRQGAVRVRSRQGHRHLPGVQGLSLQPGLIIRNPLARDSQAALQPIRRHDPDREPVGPLAGQGRVEGGGLAGQGQSRQAFEGVIALGPGIDALRRQGQGFLHGLGQAAIKVDVVRAALAVELDARRALQGKDTGHAGPGRRRQHRREPVAESGGEVAGVERPAGRPGDVGPAGNRPGPDLVRRVIHDEIAGHDDLRVGPHGDVGDGPILERAGFGVGIAQFGVDLDRGGIVAQGDPLRDLQLRAPFAVAEPDPGPAGLLAGFIVPGLLGRRVVAPLGKIEPQAQGGGHVAATGLPELALVQNLPALE